MRRACWRQSETVVAAIAIGQPVVGIDGDRGDRRPTAKRQDGLNAKLLRLDRQPDALDGPIGVAAVYAGTSRRYRLSLWAAAAEVWSALWSSTGVNFLRNFVAPGPRYTPAHVCHLRDDGASHSRRALSLYHSRHGAKGPARGTGSHESLWRPAYGRRPDQPVLMMIGLPARPR